MDYFELYDLPISFSPDQNLVKRKFYELSKKYHPDFYINEGSEKQAEVLELSTLNNKAFQLLKDRRKVLAYVLELKGELITGENYTLPQSFLLEMMDVNEALMELQFDPDEKKKAVIDEQINQIDHSLTEQLNILTDQFDHRSGADQGHILKQIKDLYYRMKYVARLRDKIKN